MDPHKKYVALSTFNCAAHPTELVESDLLATVKSPLDPAVTIIDIDKSFIQKITNVLSDAQCDAFLLCLQQFHKDEGFLLGDGAGVGKGRIIAAVIAYYMTQKNQTSIWITSNTDLYESCKRDIFAIYETLELPMPNVYGIYCKHHKNMIPVYNANHQAIYLMTYTYISKKLQIVESEFPNTFPGVIVLDEVQKAHNCSDDYMSGASCANATLQLQRHYFNSKIIYATATTAAKGNHLRIMEKLKLWGDGTIFINFQDVVNFLLLGGIPASEILTTFIKESGKGIFRQLSCNGAEYQKASIEITEHQVKFYNDSAKLWQYMGKVMQKSCNQSAKKLALFWCNQQLYFKQLLVSYKVPFIVPYVREVLHRNKRASVVISLVQTGEHAALQREETNYSSSPLRYALNKIWKITTSLICVEEEMASLYEYVIHNLPDNSLDILISQLGSHEKVAELTGRRFTALHGDNVDQKGMQRLHIDHLKEMASFNTGMKRIAILSEACSVGISLHGSSSTYDERYHIVIETPWSPESAIQQIGRTNRTGQAVKPKYILAVTNISGELRFSFPLEMRLKALGAMSTGNHKLQSAELWDTKREFFEEEIIQSLLKILSIPLQKNCFFSHDEEIALNALKNFACKFYQKSRSKNITPERFFNRMLMMEINMQNKVLEILDHLYDEKVHGPNTITTTTMKNIDDTLPHLYDSKQISFFGYDVYEATEFNGSMWSSVVKEKNIREYSFYMGTFLSDIIFFGAKLVNVAGNCKMHEIISPYLLRPIYKPTNWIWTYECVQISGDAAEKVWKKIENMIIDGECSLGFFLGGSNSKRYTEKYIIFYKNLLSEWKSIVTYCNETKINISPRVVTFNKEVKKIGLLLTEQSAFKYVTNKQLIC